MVSEVEQRCDVVNLAANRDRRGGDSWVPTCAIVRGNNDPVRCSSANGSVRQDASNVVPLAGPVSERRLGDRATADIVVDRGQDVGQVGIDRVTGGPNSEPAK